jgi:hypothetical protein
MSACLWICHACEAIGEEADAERHMEAAGHAIEKLDQVTSDAVRRAWLKDRCARIVAPCSLRGSLN